MKRSEIKARLLEVAPSGLTLATTLLLISLVIPSGALKAQAAGQDDLLPPEVVPIDPHSAGGSNAANQTAPGLVDPSNANGTAANANQMQSAQDFRKALMDSLAGKGSYPQFNGRNPYGNQFSQNNQFAQGGQPINQMGNQSFANQGQPPLGQADLMNPNPNQDTTMANATPPQTQTLSGPVGLPQTANRGGNPYAHGLGNATSLGATLYSGAMTGGQGLYSLGLTGASLLNYGYQNGGKGF
jgi:hypothetical protein